MFIKILILNLITSVLCFSQWKWINPTTSNHDVNEIKFYGDGNIAIGGKYKNLIISKDGGINWEYQSNFADADIFKIHFHHADTLFKIVKEFSGWGILYTELQKSEDGGKKWMKVELPVSGYIYDAAFYDRNIWISILEGGGCIPLGNSFLHSSDLGETWRIVDTNFLPSCYPLLAVSDSILIAQSINVRLSFSYYIFKSNDGGQNWEEKFDLGSYSLSDLRIINHNLIIGGGFGGLIARSTDIGESWSIDFLPNLSNIVKICNIGDTLFALSRKDNISFVYRSVNLGDNWNKVFEYNGKLNTISVRPNGEIWSGGEYGRIFISNDKGLSWRKRNFNYTQNFNSVSFSNPFNGWIAGDSGTILRTTDKGKTWNYQDSPTQSNLVKIKFYPNTIKGFLVSDEGRVYRTQDGGDFWSEVFYDENRKIKNIDFVDLNSIIAVGDSGFVIISTDDGTNWREANFNISSAKKFAGLSIPSSDAIFLAYDNNLYKSVDSTRTWNLIFNSNKEIKSIFFPDKMTGYILIDDNIFFKTSDGGTNWRYYNFGFYSHLLHKIYFIDSLKGWALGQFLLSTSNGGNTWNPLFHINGKDIFVDKNGIGWIIGNNGTLITNSKNEVNPPQVIEEYKLYQNYPNPFNAGTIIKYDLPSEGFVSLKIFNILGQKIDELVNQYQETGSYNVLWQPKNLPSGIYIYQLQQKNVLLSKKMILIK